MIYIHILYIYILYILYPNKITNQQIQVTKNIKNFQGLDLPNPHIVIATGRHHSSNLARVPVDSPCRRLLQRYTIY